MRPYLLHHLLHASAGSHPEAPAVVDGERTLSYADLERRSNQLAQLLREQGVRRGDRVGLYLEKSAASVVGIYGAMKAGAAYVPIDPRAPVARASYIAGNCGIRALVTAGEKAGTWAQLLHGESPIEALVLPGEDAPDADIPRRVPVFGREAVDGQPAEPPGVPVVDQDLAYILYTSGSTGDPKGVMLSHRNAMTFVEWAADLVAVRPEDRLSSHAPLHFDLSIFDLFAAALGGASVHLVPPETSVFPVEVVRFIEGHGITVWYSVPSILSMLTLRGGLGPGALPTLRTVVFAGEVFPTKYLRELMRLVPHAEFLNLYGPTETNVCTWYRVPDIPEDQTEPIPIGRAIDNLEVFAVTDDGRLASPGEVGELHVRGGGVMQGYWGDPERTSRVLIANPFGGEVRDPVYRTGDLVREDEDGNYRFLGRRDSQIKSRGYRIELGEIEAALNGHPSIVECAVVAVPDELITNRIEAYVVVRDGVDAAHLIRFCSERLPSYMIPQRFRFSDTLPKTSTGKIDRQALRARS
ncbi:MAG TPA: amino acid adenylation domain-containing protein [Actinomycetota bacterium]|nr:amino acid adenylation domain-containing protein [Actinomycetota bacterium]